MALLDAFDIPLATATAGLPHQAAAARLTERPFVRHDPFALWPYHLHALIRSTLRSADDSTDDRWTDADWKQAAARALAALGDQWRSHNGPDRRLLVACLRQGLALARDHQLDLGWLTDAGFAYTDDYVWEPLPLPEGSDTHPATAADALTELLSTLARRQHEHRSTTVARLTGVLDTGQLPLELADIAIYYRAKAQRDLGHNDASRDGMRHVANNGGRLAPDAARGLAHLARMAGDFPAALATAETLGWPGRGQRVLGDVHFAHGDMDQAAAAFTAARTDAEAHGNLGEQAIAQANLALTIAFTDPARADDEIALAEQLLAGLDQRATTLTTQIAARALRAEIDTAGISAARTALDLALAFHHAVLGQHDDLTATIERLREATTSGDFAYYVHIAAAMGGLPQPDRPAIHWLDDDQTVRERWRALVEARRTRLRQP
ncbi:hypothetical protein ACWC0C_47320 [Streptomyces sp. NPDC001709]